MTPFQCRVGMSKFFCSFDVGFNRTFYGAFYFVKGLIKLLIFYFCEELIIVGQENRF